MIDAALWQALGVQIAILGPGGVGGFLAAALTRASEESGDPKVIVLAREQAAAVINERGIELRSVRLGDFRTRPRAVGQLIEDVDVLIVATKATGLGPALERVVAEPRLVVPLLNGLDHMALLKARFGAERVAAATIRIEADRPEPGVIVQTSPFLRVDLASAHAGLKPALIRLADVLAAAGVPAQVHESESQILWSKLVRLCALALTTSAADRPIGEIRGDRQWRPSLERAINEAAAVAVADGAAIDPARPLKELEDAHPGLGSSMQRDIAAGRVPELDAIAGAVLRAGRRHGLRCPTIAELTLQVAARAGIEPPAI